MRTSSGKEPLASALQKSLLARFNRNPRPWIHKTGKDSPWLGFWPVEAGGAWAGCYALGEKKGRKGFGREESQVMELLAARTGSHLDEGRLWKLLEAAGRQSSLGFLAAALIHEIRNPLTALSTMAQLLPQKRDDENFIRSFEKTMLRETDRLVYLTENFLGFLKPGEENGGQVDFTETVGQMTTLLRPLFTSRDVRFEEENTAGLYLRGDGNQLKSLVLNLAQNALESAGPQGLVRLSTAWRPHSDLGPGPWIEFKVENSGETIVKEDLGRLFTPYFSTREKGTGLGLAICEKITQNHRGVIRVSSSKNRTKFRVFLPGLFRKR